MEKLCKRKHSARCAPRNGPGRDRAADPNSAAPAARAPAAGVRRRRPRAPPTKDRQLRLLDWILTIALVSNSIQQNSHKMYHYITVYSIKIVQEKRKLKGHAKNVEFIRFLSIISYVHRDGSRPRINTVRLNFPGCTSMSIVFCQSFSIRMDASRCR